MSISLYPTYLLFKKKNGRYDLKNPRQDSSFPSYYLHIDDEVLIIFNHVFREYNLKSAKKDIINAQRSELKTETLGIDIYNDVAIIGDELYRFDIEEHPTYTCINEENKWPRIKMKKEDLIGFMDLWLKLVDKKVDEIFIGRNKNKLALWGDGQSYEANFSLIYSEKEI